MNNFRLKLGKISNESNSFSFRVKDKFFEKFTYEDIKYVDINAKAFLKKENENFSLKLIIDGCINKLACDICADEMSLKISGETKVIIKKTNEEINSTDEIFYIKKNENTIDLTQLIFELIVVNVPKKRKHPLDEHGNSTCNQNMVNLISKYTKKQSISSDPRWNKLKKLI